MRSSPGISQGSADRGGRNERCATRINRGHHERGGKQRSVGATSSLAEADLGRERGGMFAVNGIDVMRPGWQDDNSSPRRPAPHHPAQADDVRHAQPPMLLAGGTAPKHHPTSDALPGHPIASMRAPNGWPTKMTTPVWSWLASCRPPLPVMVTGAEGGVGTSTIAALVAETIAAGSPGPTMLLDQSGSSWGSLARRLLGQRGGLSGEHARSLLQQGFHGRQVLSRAPTTSAGAAVVADCAAYTPVRELIGLVQTANGTMIVDGGPTNLMLTARLDVHTIVVLVGRADVIGAEAVCAAVGFLSRHIPVHPVVVLSSTAPINRRRVEAARKLVATTGVPHLVIFPFDTYLAATAPLRLDKAVSTACLRLVAAIGKTQEVLGHVR